MIKYFLFFIPFFLAASDFQVWVDGQTQVPIQEKATFEYRYSYRIDQNGSRFYFIYQQGRLIFPAGETWAVAPGYRQVFVLQDKWNPQYRPIFDFMKWGALKGFDWEYRNRFQYDTSRRVMKNRNRLLVKFPRLGLLRPVWYEEIFYELFSEVVQYRHYFGCEAVFEDYFQFRVGYLLRKIKLEEHWQKQDILYFELYHTY